MENMIERYVYAVVRRLPEKIREEVTNELKANIYDMLPEKPSDDEIEKVLLDLGRPRDLAVKYQPKERYVISPKYYDDYIYTLKIVTIIFILIGFTLGLIDAIINTTQTNPFYLFFEVLGEVFSGVFESIFSAFAIVTLIFVIIEQVNIKNVKCEWEIKNLPDLPKAESKKISRTGVIFEIIFGTTFGVIFVMILHSYHTSIGIYESGELVAHFFNPAAIAPFLYIFASLLVLSVLVGLIKLYDGIWTKRVAAIYTLYEVSNAIAVLVFIRTPNLILNEFVVKMSEITDYTTVQITNGFETGITVLTFITIFGLVIGLSATWYKVLSGKNK